MELDCLIHPKERLQRWQNSGKWHKYKGYSIFCQMAGQEASSETETETAPLVLIHGFPTASWDWQGVWGDLADKYAVITIDMIGFGFSDKPVDYQYSIVDQADLFESVLQGLGVSRCHLLCHDYGNSVGQELLARQSLGSSRIQVESICFLNGGIFPEAHKPALIQRMLLSPLGSLVSKLVTRRGYELNMQRIFGPLTQPTDTQLKEFWQLLEYNNGRAVLHRQIHYLEERQCLRQRWVQPLINGIVPMCFINGIEDPVAGANMVARYKALIPNPYVVELVGVGHYPQVEIPIEVVKGYFTFRERHDAGTAH